MTTELSERLGRLRDDPGVGELIDALGVAVYMTDADGLITLFNEAAAQLWGRRPAIGTDAWCGSRRLFYPDGSAMETDDYPMAMALREGRGMRVEAIAERPDGSRVWFEAFPTPVLDEAGTVAGAVNVLVDVTERKRSELLLSEQKRLLEVIASGSSLDDVLSALCSGLPRLNPRARASVLLADDERLTFPRSIAPDLLPSFGAGLKDAPINDLYISTCGEAAYSGTPIGCSDIANDERWSREWRDLCLANGIRACHSAPVPGADGQPVASFMLCFDEAREPDEWEFRLSDFGTHIASIAIERHRSSAALRAHEQQMATELAAMQRLHAVSSEMVGEDDVERLYDQILDAAVAIMGSEYASIQMLYPERGDGGELRLLGFRGFNPDAARFWEWVRPASESTCGMALRTRQRCVVEDVTQCEFMAGSDDLATYLATGIHAVQTTPLLSRSGVLVGMISTHWSHPHAPAERDLRMLDLLARQAADLIERARADEERDRLVQQLETLLATAPLGVYLVDSRFRVSAVNPVALPSFGGIPDLIGRDLDEILHALWPKEYADEVVGLFRHTLDTGESHIMAERAEERRDLGVTEYYEWRIDRIVLPDGQYGAVCYFRDISAQVAAREKTAESESRYRVLFDSIDEGFCLCELILDAEGKPADYRFLDVNPLFGEMTGISPDATGRTARDLVPGLEDWWFETYGRVVLTGQAERFEHGSEAMGRILDVYVMPVGPAGSLRFAIVFNDISERKQAEEQMRQASALKDEFLGLISHELRTPITTVLGNADVLMRRGDALDLETRTSALRDVRDNAERLNRLVGDLLTVARAERGALEVEPLALVRVVSGIIEECREELRRPIRMTANNQPLLVNGHEGVVSQIVRNYLTNAEKYGGTGGSDVIIERAGSEALVRVVDRGIGIDATEAESLFDPFYRAKDAGLVGGLGLGLSVCKRLAEAVGGRVWAAARDGGGSEFGLALPLNDEVPESQEYGRGQGSP